MITNLGAIRRAHAELLRGTKMATLRASHKAADHGIRWSRANPPYTKRTGALAAATRKKVIRLKGGARVILQNPSKIAHYIEKGTKPHFIRARRAPVLAFYWTKIGAWVFTPLVLHPGTMPYRFLSNATHQAALRFSVLIGPELRRLASRF